MNLVFVVQEKSTKDAAELYKNIINEIKAINPKNIIDITIFLDFKI